LRRVVEMTQGVDDAEEDRPEFWGHIAKRKKGSLVELTIQEVEDEDDDVLDVTANLFKLKSKIHEFSTGPYDKLSDGINKPFRYHIQSTEIYLLDTGFDYLVWVGKDADPQLCKGDSTFKVFPLALLYVKRYSRPGQLPIHIYKEGLEPLGFWERFDHSPYIPTKFEAAMDYAYAFWLSVLAWMPGQKRDVTATKISVQQNDIRQVGMESAISEQKRGKSEFLDI